MEENNGVAGLEEIFRRTSSSSASAEVLKAADRVLLEVDFSPAAADQNERLAVELSLEVRIPVLEVL